MKEVIAHTYLKRSVCLILKPRTTHSAHVKNMKVAFKEVQSCLKLKPASMYLLICCSFCSLACFLCSLLASIAPHSSPSFVPSGFFRAAAFNGAIALNDMNRQNDALTILKGMIVTLREQEKKEPLPLFLSYASRLFACKCIFENDGTCGLRLSLLHLCSSVYFSL